MNSGAGLDFSGRVAVVTGSARGIGIEIARRLPQRGATVQLADIDSETLASEWSGRSPIRRCKWRRIMDIDLTGTFLCCRAAAREMVKAGYGRIVNPASTAGIRGGTGRAAYGAAKGGIIELTRVVAVEFASSEVTVNALAPGAMHKNR